MLSGCLIYYRLSVLQNMLCQQVFCIIGYGWTFRKTNLIYVVIVVLLVVECEQVVIHLDSVIMYVKECTLGAL